MAKMQMSSRIFAAGILVLLIALGSGCVGHRPRGARPTWREEGFASWYGVDFHGRRTANGERYNMYAMTAAHKTLPLGTPVTVTHRDSGRRIRVRINDRGPFVAGRIIDLSYAAARALGLAESGVAPVLVEANLPAWAFAAVTPPAPAPVETVPEPQPPPGAAAVRPGVEPPPPLRGAFAIQVGAFGVEENARRLAVRLGAEFATVRVLEFQDNRGPWWRVRIGGYASDGEARAAAAGFEAKGLAGFVVRED